MLHRLCDTIACNHVGYCIFFGPIWSKVWVFQYLGNTLPQLANFSDFLWFIRLKVAIHNSFLGMPKAIRFGNGDHFVNFIHIQIPSSSIVVFEKWHDCLVPAFEHPFFAWICWVKIDS